MYMKKHSTVFVQYARTHLFIDPRGSENPKQNKYKAYQTV